MNAWELANWAEQNPDEFYDKYLPEIVAKWGVQEWAALVRNLPKDMREAVILAGAEAGLFKITLLSNGSMGFQLCKPPKIKAKNNAGTRIHNKTWAAYHKTIELYKEGHYLYDGDIRLAPPQPPKFPKDHVATVTALIVEEQEDE